MNKRKSTHISDRLLMNIFYIDGIEYRENCGNCVHRDKFYCSISNMLFADESEFNKFICKNYVEKKKKYWNRFISLFILVILIIIL